MSSKKGTTQRIGLRGPTIKLTQAASIDRTTAIAVAIRYARQLTGAGGAMTPSPERLLSHMLELYREQIREWERERSHAAGPN